MKNSSKYKAFLIPFAAWLIIGFFILLKIDKGDLVLWFNENRTPLTNFYFMIASDLAEWRFILLFAAIIFYKQFGNTFIYLLTWALTGIVAQSLKRVFDLPRPAGYYKDITLNFINGDITHYAHSFPSGHTTTAFALFFVMAMITEKKYLQFIFFVLALSTAFARVYLLQHFFIDVYFGSILGTILAYFIFVSIDSSNIFGFQNWKNKRILKKF